jgi:hypothetical protein
MPTLFRPGTVALVWALTVLALAAGCGSGAKQPPGPPASEARTPPLPVEPIGRGQLQPRAAFVAFDNRTALDDSLLDTVFHGRMVEKARKEAGKTQLVLPGNAAYPSGLAGFSRDPFGRLDAFGLAAFARQENLNAVVSGMVLDASVTNELGGILLWKAPEGRLRLLLLVEIYSPATATKVFSRSFTYDAEVPGMAPDADGTLRESDLALLRKGLEELAEEIGEAVGETLADLPWQGFVTDLSGDRVTLSSDASSGLRPGHLLRLYDSRVMDGLDGRKFFLNDDPMGSMQVTEVAPDRVHGVLLQGEGIGIYTFAAP